MITVRKRAKLRDVLYYHLLFSLGREGENHTERETVWQTRIEFDIASLFNHFIVLFLIDYVEDKTSCGGYNKPTKPHETNLVEIHTSRTNENMPSIAVKYAEYKYRRGTKL